MELTKGLELNPTTLAGDVNALCVLPEGVFDVGDAFGFVFSSRNILRNAERARDAWNGKFPGECDGSWKFVYCGWPILAFGTHHVYYVPKTGAIRHQFRPIIIIYVRKGRVPRGIRASLYKHNTSSAPTFQLQNRAMLRV